MKETEVVAALKRALGRKGKRLKCEVIREGKPPRGDKVVCKRVHEESPPSNPVVVPCTTLEHMLGEQNQKGIVQRNIFDLRGRERMSAPVYKLAAHFQQGMLLNFCPWCGTCLGGDGG